MSAKYALIIGNTEYIDPGFAQLSAPVKDAEEFARVLKDQEIGAFDNVNILLNQPSSIITEAIDEFFGQKKPDDLLLLYFSGHDVRDELGVLYLAVKNTVRNRLRSTGIKSDYIRDAMDQSRSKRQVLILDCTNSGEFSQGTKAELGGSMGMVSAFQGYGRFVLTASDATQFAWEGDKVIGETGNSLFTHFLVKGLEGEADNDGDGRITVDELYDYAYNQVSMVTPKQTPTKSASKMEGEIVLRQSMPIENLKPMLLPTELMDEIEDTRPFVREIAVQKLEKILKGKNIGLARSAREVLEKIVEDENTTRHVAQLATQVLDSTHQLAYKVEEELKASHEAEALAISKAEEERLASKKDQAQRKAKEKAERIALAKTELEATERESIRLKEEREATQKAARESVEKASKEKAVKEVAEREAARLAARKKAERDAAENVKREASEKVDKFESKKGKNLKISVAYPKLLSKRFASSFLLQIYLPEERSQVTRNIESEFVDQKTSEYMQLSSIRMGQRLKLKFFSPAIDFSDAVIKLIDRPVNKVILLGMPKDNCETGLHKISVSISDADKGQELESFTITVQVIDFAFDHISRPMLSRVSAVVLGIGSFAMFILTSLEQIDKTVGLTSGTATGVLAIGVYASFYNLYQRVRPNTP
jgi:hypothetical protein